jgi:hypothetical protein
MNKEVHVSSSLPHRPQEAKEYLADLQRALKTVFPKSDEQRDRQVFIPRPTTLPVFSDAMLDVILEKIDNERLEKAIVGFKHAFGGKVITFLSPSVAEEFTCRFPLQVKIGKTEHEFATAPVPEIYQGVRYRINGLPIGVDGKYVKIIGEILALHPSNLLHADCMRSRRGHATDKGILIFSVAPISLLLTTSWNIGGNKISFTPLDKDSKCNVCLHKGHASEHCPYEHVKTLPKVDISKYLPAEADREDRYAKNKESKEMKKGAANMNKQAGNTKGSKRLAKNSKSSTGSTQSESDDSKE